MAALPVFLTLCMVSLVTGQLVETSPKYEVRRAGEAATFVCRVAHRIDSCRVRVGADSLALSPRRAAGGDREYAGRGFEFGECGVRLSNIREEWSGDITCFVPPESGAVELTGTMRLVVAKAPAQPELVAAGGTYREGDLVQAECVVRDGRPAATISWFLDDTALPSGAHEPRVTGADLLTVAQNVTHRARAADHGAALRCVAAHPAWDAPAAAALQLSVLFPPSSTDGAALTVFGLSLGARGRLNVTVRAHPAPAAEWTVGGETLLPGGAGRVRALPPLPLGHGVYNLSLEIQQLLKEDVEKTYYLRATNELGRDDVTVRLSTMAEPDGVALGTGAIVGIVVGVLLLLSAVLLLVFAKATERWCFGAAGRDGTKNSGESTPAGDVLLESGIQLTAKPSDTESAAGAAVAGGGQPGARSARARLAALGQGLGGLGARVRARLPRGKDRVVAADTTDDKTSEEKKNIVYAELALGEARDKPPAPAGTEYAQIVYKTEGDAAPADPKDTKDQ